ncbi:MAG: metallophosphoesterase family protein [Phycisphaerae bacterium]
MSGIFRLLTIGDVHYDPHGQDQPERKPTRGAELVHAAISAGRESFAPHAIALMGDLVEDGNDPRTPENLRALADAALSAAGDVPLLVVPGNHDVDAARLLAAFGAMAGPIEMTGCRLFVFVDEWWADDTGHRRWRQQRRFVEWASGGQGPLVVLQHNPIYPPVENDFPYALSEHEQVVADYSAVGVTLSVSGHYHAGLPLTRLGPVAYFTCPALHKPPHPYAEIAISLGEAEVTLRNLIED